MMLKPQNIIHGQFEGHNQFDEQTHRGNRVVFCRRSMLLDDLLVFYRKVYLLDVWIGI